eukprot:scaffold5490_cov148-Skeletonema_marinoi.AAC.2
MCGPFLVWVPLQFERACTTLRGKTKIFEYTAATRDAESIGIAYASDKSCDNSCVKQIMHGMIYSNSAPLLEESRYSEFKQKHSYFILTPSDVKIIN